MAAHLFETEDEETNTSESPWPGSSAAHTRTRRLFSGGAGVPNGAAKSKVTLSQLGWMWCLALLCDRTSPNALLLRQALKLPPNYQSRSRRELFSATHLSVQRLSLCPPTLKEVSWLRDIICECQCWCQQGLRLANVLWSSGQQALLLLLHILSSKIVLIGYLGFLFNF